MDGLRWKMKVFERMEFCVDELNGGEGGWAFNEQL